jgi:hypothetical protein
MPIGLEGMKMVEAQVVVARQAEEAAEEMMVKAADRRVGVAD